MSELPTFERPANNYRPEANAGWERRLVMTRCAGGWRYLLCEVLWADGVVTLARPVAMPFSASAELWQTSWDAVVEAGQSARKRPPLEVDPGCVDWARLQR